MAPRRRLAPGGLTKHKQDRSDAKYEQDAHMSRSSGALMEHNNKQQQAEELDQA